jgi:hypothetical protein
VAGGAERLHRLPTTGKGDDVVAHGGQSLAAHHAEGLLLEEFGAEGLQLAPTDAVMLTASALPRNDALGASGFSTIAVYPLRHTSLLVWLPEKSASIVSRTFVSG